MQGNVGGLAGSVWNRAYDCENHGTVQGLREAGGIAGTLFDEGAVSQCRNLGAVQGGAAGGIVGAAQASYVIGARFSRCWNGGSVSGSAAGGIVGSLGGGAIAGCYNAGEIAGTRAGGLAATTHNGGRIHGCYNVGAVSGAEAAGAIVAENGEVTDCWYLDDCGASGDGTAVTAAQLRELAALPGPAGIWRHSDTLGRPVLAAIPEDGADAVPVAFSDVPYGAWYADAVQYACTHGLMEGVGGGSFRPGQAVSRAQLAALLMRMTEDAS